MLSGLLIAVALATTPCGGCTYVCQRIGYISVPPPDVTPTPPATDPRCNCVRPGEDNRIPRDFPTNAAASAYVFERYSSARVIPLGDGTTATVNAVDLDRARIQSPELFQHPGGFNPQLYGGSNSDGQQILIPQMDVHIGDTLAAGGKLHSFGSVAGAASLVEGKLGQSP